MPGSLPAPGGHPGEKAALLTDAGVPGAPGVGSYDQRRSPSAGSELARVVRTHLRDSAEAVLVDVGR